MLTIPLQPIPNQTLQVQLGTQPCTIGVAQFRYGLFLTLSIGTTTIVANALCQNFNRLVRSAYLGFDGDLFFLDTQGEENPVYTGLGGAAARFQLVYATAAELGGVP